MVDTSVVWSGPVPVLVFLAAAAIFLVILAVVWYRQRRNGRPSPYLLEPVSIAHASSDGNANGSVHRLIEGGPADRHFLVEFTTTSATEYARLPLLKRWALDSRVKKEYRSARGYQHLAVLKRAKKQLQREIAFHQKKSKSLGARLAAVELDERKAVQAAAEMHLLGTRFDEVHGVGPALQRDIFAQLQPRALTDLHRAGSVRGIGPARQQAINAWVKQQQDYLAQHPEVPFPGRKELVAPFAPRIQELREQRAEHERAVVHKTEVLAQLTQAVDNLKKTRPKDYVRAAKRKPDALARVEAFEHGVFDPIQPVPEWFQEAVDGSEQRASGLRATSHLDAKNLPLDLSFYLDVDDDGRRVLDARCGSIVGQVAEHRVPFEEIAQFGYVETSQDKRRLYRVFSEDRQLLFALRRLGVGEDLQGRMIIDPAPDVLARLRRQPSIVESERSAQVRIIDEPVQPVLFVDYIPGQGLRLKAGYSDSAEIIEPAAVQQVIDGTAVYARTSDGYVRLLLPKREAGRKLLSDGGTTVAPKKIPAFFTGDLPQLKKEFRTVLSASAIRIQVVEAKSTPVVKVDMGAPGWLSLQVQHDTGSASWSHAQLAAAPDSGGYRQVDEYTWLKTPRSVEQVAEALDELDAEPSTGGYRVPLARFASLDDFASAIGVHAIHGDGYQAFLKDLTGFRADSNYRLVDALERDLQRQALHLRPYQRAGIHWMDWLNANHLHGLLADDMGLGKTLQALCAMRQAYARTDVRKHSLIVAPKSVMVHWQREFKRVFPEMPVYLHHGNERQQSRQMLQRSDRPAVFVTTYATAANDIGFLADVPFFFVLLDEATNVKNPTAKRTQSIKQLKADHRVALSGTPVENRPSELWSVFDFLMAGHLGRYGTFQRVFEGPILNGDNRASAQLGHRVGPFMLRRQKREVAKDLPEKIEMSEWCELTEEQRTLYRSFQTESERVRTALAGGEQVNYPGVILPLLTKLKQVCDHPALISGNMNELWGRSEKFDLIFDKVRAIREKQEQVVIFSHFLGMLDLFERACQVEKLAYIRIDGSTTDRQARIDRFNNHEATVALGSLMAAGHGINLTAANHVIHADRWWNPAIEAQATDRVHRIGQDKNVFVYRVLVQGTLEEWIDSILVTKRRMAEQIVGAAGEKQLMWTREELLEILKPLA